MPGWNRKRFAAHGLVWALVGLCGGFQMACHKTTKQDNFTNAPELSYRTPVILATAGVPFASVAPDVSAFVVTNSVGTFVKTGFRFTALPGLPAGLVLDPGTGVISGTPAAAAAPAPCTLTATNGGGGGSFTVSLGVLASSPVTLDYAGTGAVSAAVGGSLSLDPPAVSGVPGGTLLGFGVNPALPAGLTLNAANGLVSGSPTAALPATPFTLTVTTPSGSGNAVFTLVVSATAPAAPQGSYPALPPATAAQAYAGPVPAISGMDLVYTVTPALPQGLALDPLTGQVTGTPAGATASATYTFTAANGGGNIQTAVAFVVN